MAIRLLIIGMLVIAGMAPAFAVEPDPRFKSLRQEIKASIKMGPMVSLSIGVIENGRVVWAESFGYADREELVEATPETPYGVASLGKSLTATALMTLVDKGDVRLENPVSQVLGAGAVRKLACNREPTVGQLLNMTAGVPHGASTYHWPSAIDERELVKRRSVAAFCPGDVYHYSNYSIALADSVIERAAGMPFDAYLAKAVLAPLGMRNASVGAGKRPPAARDDAQGARLPVLFAYPRSSRQINASLTDLLHYSAFQLGTPFRGQKAIFGTEVRTRMHQEVPAVPGALLALGWASVVLPDRSRWLVSNGNDLGIQSMLTLLPDRNVAIVILSNSSGFEAEDYAARAAELVAPGFTAAVAEARKLYEAAISLKVPPSWRGAWRGEVETSSGPKALSLEIDASGGVAVSLTGSRQVELAGVQYANGVLTGHFTGHLHLEETAAGPHRIEVTLHRNGESATGFLTAIFQTHRGRFEIPTGVSLRRTGRK